MSKSSEAVKKWRENTKARMVASLGGKCVCCGYNASEWALEFHHINRESKNFSFGSMRANPKSWLTVVEELRKCVLLCANCHREIEHGIRSLPDVYPVFNEEYVDYKNHHTTLASDKKYVDIVCPECQTEFSAYLGRTKRCFQCRAVKRDLANGYHARKNRGG